MARHVDESKDRRKTYIKVAGVAAGGMAVPMVAPSMAQAAPESEWEQVAACETNGGGDNEARWHMDSGHSTSTGGLQFQRPSWGDAISRLGQEGLDTSAYPGEAYQATRLQQILAGEALLSMQGPQAWAVTWNGAVNSVGCAGLLGNGSMFDGGANPFGQGADLQDIAHGGDGFPDGSDDPEPDPDADVHVVQSGDTLWHLAETHLGDGERWSELYDLNRDVVGGDPDVIEIGMELRLKAAPQFEDYEVRPGDTLFAIAERTMGDGHEWGQIYNHGDNRSVVGENPDVIQPGMVLAVPADGQAPDPPPPAAPAPSGGFSAPFSESWPHHYNPYGTPAATYALGYHTGMDISAPSSTPVLAVADAEVISSEQSSSFGVNVRLQHDDGMYSSYAHLSGKDVSVGERVEAGDTIGFVGSTGNSSGPHLHLEVRTAPNWGEGNFVDPHEYLKDNGTPVL